MLFGNNTPPYFNSTTETSMNLKIPLKIILVGDKLSQKSKFTHHFINDYQNNSKIQETTQRPYKSNEQSPSKSTGFTYFEKPYSDYFQQIKLIELNDYDISKVDHGQLKDVSGFIVFLNGNHRDTNRSSLEQSPSKQPSPVDTLSTFLQDLESFALDSIVINVVLIQVGVETEIKQQLTNLCGPKNINIHKEAGIFAFNVSYLLHHFFDRILQSDFSDLTQTTPLQMSSVHSPFVRKNPNRTKQHSRTNFDHLELRSSSNYHNDYQMYLQQPIYTQQSDYDERTSIVSQNQRKTFSVKSQRYFTPSTYDPPKRIKEGQVVIITEQSDENEVKVGDLNFQVLKKQKKPSLTKQSDASSQLSVTPRITNTPRLAPNKKIVIDNRGEETGDLQELKRQYANQNIRFVDETKAFKENRSECNCRIF